VIVVYYLHFNPYYLFLHVYCFQEKYAQRFTLHNSAVLCVVVRRRLIIPHGENASHASKDGDDKVVGHTSSEHVRVKSIQ